MSKMSNKAIEIAEKIQDKCPELSFEFILECVTNSNSFQFLTTFAEKTSPIIELNKKEG